MKKKKKISRPIAQPSLPSLLRSLEGWWLAKIFYAFFNLQIHQPARKKVTVSPRRIDLISRRANGEGESYTTLVVGQGSTSSNAGLKSLLGERKDRCCLCCVSLVFADWQFCQLFVYTVTACLWKACVQLMHTFLWFLQSSHRENIREVWFPGLEKSWKYL